MSVKYSSCHSTARKLLSGVRRTNDPRGGAWCAISDCLLCGLWPGRRAPPGAPRAIMTRRSLSWSSVESAPRCWSDASAGIDPVQP
jgi:hypothetical protein